MPWKEGQGLPADGWYSGDVSRMMVNGTYADYRPKLELQVQNGFYGKFGEPLEKRIADSQLKLDAWDKEWEAIPLEEREKRRAATVEKVTPVKKQIKTSQGFKTVWWSHPSDDGEVPRNKKKAPRVKTVSGSIANFDNPLVPQPV